MKLRYIPILLSLCACAGFKQRLKVKDWIQPKYELCKPNIITDDIPFDFAVNVLHTDIPTSRYDNVNSTRPYIVHKNGTSVDIGSDYVQFPYKTQMTLGNWSLDGKYIYINQIYEDPLNAMYEEAIGEFILDPNYYLADVIKVDTDSLQSYNLTYLNRISFWNAGITNFVTDPTRIGFSAIENGIQKTFTMNVDGTDKKPLSTVNGFSYGFNAANDGIMYAYHADYKIVIGNFQTGVEKQISTPCDFNFGPVWSPDSQWFVFYCGANNAGPDIYISNRDGSQVSFLASRNGYSGSVPVIDAHDFHNGSTDNIAWTNDSNYLIYAAQLDGVVQLFKIEIATKLKTQLTFVNIGTLNYYPEPSQDGKWLLFNSNRSGRRNVFLMNLSTLATKQLTDVEPGCGVYVHKWRPEID